MKEDSLSHPVVSQGQEIKYNLSNETQRANKQMTVVYDLSLHQPSSAKIPRNPKVTAGLAGDSLRCVKIDFPLTLTTNGRGQFSTDH